MSRIITINRQFGSGGREVGKRLADALQCAYYDKELLSKLSEETGFSPDFIEQFDEVATRDYGFTFARTIVSYIPTPMEKIQIEQNILLRKIAEKGNCVIIGRCSNNVLSEYNPFKVFIYSSDMKCRVERCFEKVPEDRETKTFEKMEKEILAVDKRRRKYYEYYTGEKWLNMNNYNLCIDTSKVSIKKAVELIMKALETE